MSDDNNSSLEQAKQDGKYIRTIKSFVKREGRLTKGQANALASQWPSMGLNASDGMIDPQKVFGNANPIVVEIGFGMGKSLVEMAAAAPDKNFIGIEVHRPGVGHCLMLAQEAQITNLRVYEHDAVEVLRDCVPAESITTLQLFFPDPWHKTRHHKRRIVQPAFVESVRQCLKLGGIWHMATDWENYAEHMLEVMSGSDKYRNLSPSNDYIPRPAHRPLTKFEARGERLGHGVWDLMFERIL